MVPAQDVKYCRVLTEITKDNAAFGTVNIDTKDWDYCEIICPFRNVEAAVAAMKVEESDNASDWDDLTVVGTAETVDGATSTLPGAADDDKIWVFQIDTRATKRYLKLSCTAGDGSGTHTGLGAVARLSRGAISPATAAAAGAEEIIRI